MANKQVLYISYDGMTDPLGQSQILPYLIGLSAHGYQFTLLSFEKKHRYDAEGFKIREICAKAGIDWKPLSFTSRPPILSKIYDRWRLKKKAWALHREKKFDMIHCRSYVAADVGLQLKKETGTKFFFDMRGFWADEKVDGGQWDQRKAIFRRIYKYYKGKEKEFLLNADAIVSLTEAARLEMLRHEAYQKLDIEVIPCCADLQHFDFHNVTAEQKLAVRKKLGIAEGKKVISYLGSIGGWYMTAEMFGFVRQLLAVRPEYVMLILTKDDPERLKKEAALLGVPADRLVITFSPRQDLPQYISVSDASIFFIRPTYSKIASSPTKHAELMGMGVPVICNAIGDTGIIINDTKTGIVIDQFTEDAFRSAALEMTEVEKIDRDKIREAAFRYFDLKNGVQQYLKLYQRVIG